MFILISTGNIPIFKKGLLTTIIFADDQNTFYGLEGAIETGGMMIEFLIK